MWLFLDSRDRKQLLEFSDEAPVELGRALDAGILIEDDASSRRHARIERDAVGAGYQLHDLESRNGTRLNGRFVRVSRLAVGDRIEIGATVVHFCGSDEARARELQRRSTEAAARPDGEPEVFEFSRDPLTGLSTLPVVQSKLAHLLAAPGPVVVIKLDLDYLGMFNDMFGMAAGDEVIRQAAFGLRSVADGSSAVRVCGREAGGKFVLAVCGSVSDAEALAEACRAEVGRRPLQGVLRQATLTLSAGVAARRGTTPDWQALLNRAEAALAKAKVLGRDQVRVAASGEGEGVSAQAKGALLRAVRETRASGAWGAERAEASAAAESPLEELQPLALTEQGRSLLALVAGALGADLEAESLLELILTVVGDAVGARRGFLLLRHGRGDGFGVAVSVDRDAPGSRRESAVSQGVLREAAETRAAVVVDDARQDPRFQLRESVQQEGARSILAAPMVWDEAVIGLLYLDDKTRDSAFGAAQRDLVVAFCRLVAGPIRRHMLQLSRARELARTRAALARGAEAERARAVRYRSLVGRSEPMQRLQGLLERLEGSEHPVLIQGESGTGKELIARAIYENGARAGAAFVAENCAALTETLLESELFGQVKGAFSGADEDRPGLFEAADGGTLFLDEIGETSPAMQGKLLRVLQDGELRPVGGQDVRRVDVRLICASHRDLRAMVEAGTFREDLYYRIAVMTVEVPPLRERRDDIPLLLDHFLAQAADEAGRRAPSVDREALALLCRHPWPGNVRELVNECRKLVMLGSDPVTSAELSPQLRGEGLDGAESPTQALEQLAIQDGVAAMRILIEQGKPLAEAAEAVEIELIRQVLAEAHGNRSETARRLGISRPGLQGKLKRYGIE